MTNIKVTQKGTKASITVSLKESNYLPKLEENLKMHSKSFYLKGFRGGYAPLGVIKKMYGKNILLKTVKSIVENQLSEFYEKNNIIVLDKPKVVYTNLDTYSKNQFENPSGDIVFCYEVHTPSEFDVVIDKSIEVDQFYVEDVDQRYVNSVYDRIKRVNGKIKQAENGNQGNVFYGDINYKEDLFDKKVDIFLDNVKEDKKSIFKDLVVGSTVNLDLLDIFEEDKLPLDIPKNIIEKVSKNKEHFVFKVEAISNIIPAKADSVFFEKIYPKKNVKSESEFKDILKQDIINAKNEFCQNIFKLTIKKMLLKSINIDLPEDIIKQNLNFPKTRLNSKQKEDFEIYKKEIKFSVIADKIAFKNNLKVFSDEDLLTGFKYWAPSQVYQHIISQHGKTPIELMKKYVSTLKPDKKNNFLNHVKIEKVFNFIKNNITKNKKIVTLDELDKIITN